MKHSFSGKVVNGKLSLYDQEGFDRAYRDLEGKPILLTIERETHRRSNSQNAFLFGVVYKMIADDTGDDIETIHQEMKMRFLPTVVERTNKQTGETEEIVVPGKSRKLTTQEFSEYWAKIQVWAAQFLNITIPDPGQTEWIE